MRKFVDMAARKKELQQERLRAQISANAKRNQESALMFSRGEADGRGNKRAKAKGFVVGRDSEYESKAYKSRGAVDSDDEDRGGHGGGNNDEVYVDDLHGEEQAIDHDHELAVDRMEFDADEFQDVDYEFDDDDDGAQDYIEGEDLHGLAEGEVELNDAINNDEDEMGEEDDDDDENGPSRPNSSSEEDDDDEEEEDLDD